MRRGAPGLDAVPVGDDEDCDEVPELESTRADHAEAARPALRLVSTTEPDPADPTSAPSRAALATKRALDVAGCLLVLPIVVPLLVAVAIGVKLTSPGPILFRQERVGRHGRPFTMLKFRTFPVEHRPPAAPERSTGTVRVPAEETPLRFGRLLRRTSIDELPQILNVLRGDMSLVGPRPERPELVAALARSVPGYAARHQVPVGLTGLAQVLGYMGYRSVEQRTAADLAYIDGWRLRRDAAIVARTLPAVLRRCRE